MREQTSKVSRILRKRNSRVSDRYEAPLHSHIAPGSSACGHTSTLAAPGVYYIPTTTATSYDYDYEGRMDSEWVGRWIATGHRYERGRWGATDCLYSTPLYTQTMPSIGR